MSGRARAVADASRQAANEAKKKKKAPEEVPCTKLQPRRSASTSSGSKPVAGLKETAQGGKRQAPPNRDTPKQGSGKKKRIASSSDEDDEDSNDEAETAGLMEAAGAVKLKAKAQPVVSRLGKYLA